MYCYHQSLGLLLQLKLRHCLKDYLCVNLYKIYGFESINVDEFWPGNHKLENNIKVTTRSTGERDILEQALQKMSSHLSEIKYYYNHSIINCYITIPLYYTLCYITLILYPVLIIQHKKEVLHLSSVVLLSDGIKDK